MNVTMTTTKNTRQSCLETSTHACSSHQDADDSSQRDCNIPIIPPKAIPENYEHKDHDDEKESKIAQRKIWKIHFTHAFFSLREADNGAQKY